MWGNVASLYAEYLSERTTDQILETEHGFATYRYLEDDKTVYILDIFVKPECRNAKLASKMADAVVSLAKERGCNKLLGSVVPQAKHATRSVQVLIGYGMTLEGASNNFVIFKKDI